MEGPYRDLGAGFARLAGTEGLRRAPAPLRSVEDALFELLRNSRDAGASNIYVASILKSRRYRVLTVIDDGHGIPESHAGLIFEPGVTTRHLAPVPEPAGAPDKPSAHGAGLSLHHIRRAAVSAEVLSASAPTSIKAVFDTRHGLPEKSLQSTTRPAASNLPAVLSRFPRQTKNLTEPPPNLYHGSPASILSRLLHNHIIHLDSRSAASLRERANSVGLEVSLRTAQRVLGGKVGVAEGVGGKKSADHGQMTERSVGGGRAGAGGPILKLGDGELSELLVVLKKVARASYLDLSGLTAEGRPGEIVIKARVYEPEEEYEDD